MCESINCPICFEHIEQLYRKWSCNHYFHESCVATWHYSCPLCRTSTRTINEIQSTRPDDPTNNIMDIMEIRQLHNVSHASRHLYLNAWTKRSCIEENHEMLIKEPYGTIVICVNCNLIKAFNRLH